MKSPGLDPVVIIIIMMMIIKARKLLAPKQEQADITKGRSPPDPALIRAELRLNQLNKQRRCALRVNRGSEAGVIVVSERSG